MITTPGRRSKTFRVTNTIINAARKRFLRLAPQARPAPQPENIIGLFEQRELWELVAAHRWPLSDADLRFLTGRSAQEPYAVSLARVATEVG